ncbi:MAG TPA: IS200/IS605 family transposase, partial [Gemmataceae bacterium]|nr:IS200/IS605 family transposase [Gemmataceae bacterium]
MPQSLSAIYVHLIFSTKNRAPLIRPEIEDALHKYYAGILRNLDSPLICAGGTTDHIHILLRLGRKMSIADLVEETKSSSSKWIRTKGVEYRDFYWQNGYGAFSIGQSGVPGVKSYIGKQKEHHRKKSFQEEFRQFLKRYEIEY